MTYLEFKDLYDKYQPWFGRPVEVAIIATKFGKQSFQKFLLMDIQCTTDPQNFDELIVSQADVLLRNLSDSSTIVLSLNEFVLNVKLINLGNSPTLRLSKSNKCASVKFGSNTEQIAFFIIQLNSHFGRPISEWTKVVSGLAICFSYINRNDSQGWSKEILLSTLITDQKQPVLYISLTFANLGLSNSDLTILKNQIEIDLKEVHPIEDDYELTLVFEKN